MKDEVKLALNRFRQAYLQLEEGTERAKDPLEKDGVIQRFEFTFELLWKTLKIAFEHQGVLCKTPRECLKSAFRLGFIKEESIFLDMLEDRNKMSHLYDKIWADEIFNRVKNKYLLAIKNLLTQLEKSY